MSLPRKKKICEGCGKERYIYAKGMCQWCYKPPSKGGTKGSSTIKPKPKKPPKPAFGFTSEKELFMHLWDKSDKVCPVSGKTLDKLIGTPWFWNCFAHILPKGRYPEYRLNPDNVMVVHPDVHDLFDNRGSDKQDQSGWDFSILREKEQQLKEQYYREFN